MDEKRLRKELDRRLGDALEKARKGGRVAFKMGQVIGKTQTEKQDPERFITLVGKTLKNIEKELSDGFFEGLQKNETVEEEFNLMVSYAYFQSLHEKQLEKLEGRQAKQLIDCGKEHNLAMWNCAQALGKLVKLDTLQSNLEVQNKKREAIPKERHKLMEQYERSTRILERTQKKLQLMQANLGEPAGTPFDTIWIGDDWEHT